MQHADDTALAAAVAADVRAPLARLTVDWDRDGTYSNPLSDLSSVVDAVTVERQITSDLPAECTLIEGYTSASLTAALSGTRPGDPRDVARMVSPYRPDSPLAGVDRVDAPITLDLGLTTSAGPRWVRQFTGTTRALRLSAAECSVTLDALDPAERLRAAVTLPVWADSERTFRNSTVWPYRNRTNTQWIVDYVLRRNGIHMSPPLRPGTIWAMTGHGGLAPDVGYDAFLILGRKSGGDAVPEFIPGRYGLAVNGGPQLYMLVRGTTAGTGFNLGSYGHLFEFHVRAGASNTFHPNADGSLLAASTNDVKKTGATVELLITTTGRLQAKLWTNPTITPVLRATITGPQITGPAAWHSVGFWMFYNSIDRQVTYRWHLDGAQTAEATVAADLGSPSGQRGEVYAQSSLPIQCLSISEVFALPPDWGAPHVSEADLDEGLNWVTALPDVVGADSWEVIKEAVAAEYGLASFGEHGRFTFRARTRPLGGPVKNITADLDLADLSPSIALDSVRNEITYTTTARLERARATVYTARTVDELDCPPGYTVHTLLLSTRCGIYTSLLRVPKANWGSGVTGGYAVVNASTGADVTNVSVEITATDTQDRVNLSVYNPNAFTVRFAAGDQPAFTVAGRPIADDEPITTMTTNPDSADRYGRRVLQLPDNRYRQHPAPARAVAESLLTDLAEPVALLADVPVVGDPRVQLADVVTVHDPHGLGGPITAAVIGSRRTLSTDEGLADVLTLRVV